MGRRMKRPSFQFYPSDWLRDTALRTCSTGARGLWIDMICHMHEGCPYGHLKVGNKVILPDNLSRMVGETLGVVEGWLKELMDAGVYDTTDEGVIYSRRMIRDESIRNARATGGKLGGNPQLLGLKDNQEDNQEDKQKPTPSSSSSSSTINNINRPDSVPEQVWNDFLKIRKAKKAPLTQTALDGIEREADEAGWTVEEAITECVTRGWQGFKAEWVCKVQQTNNRGY